MNAETKRFPFRDLLTITTGRLLTRPNGMHDNGIGSLYRILGWMTRNAPMTHQLSRFAAECKPWLIRWFPELTKVDLLCADLDLAINSATSISDKFKAIELWLLNAMTLCDLKAFYDVPRIPEDDHEIIDLYDELVAMRGTDEGILLIDGSENT